MSEPKKKFVGRMPIPNAGKVWEPDEIENLLEMFNSGSSLYEMALVHGRRLNAIRERLILLKMIPY